MTGPARVRYVYTLSPESEQLRVMRDAGGAATVDLGDYTDFQGSLEVLGPASLTSLRGALTKYAENHGRDEATVSFVDVAERKFRTHHNYEFAPEPVHLVLRGDQLQLSVNYAVAQEDEPDTRAVASLLAPLLQRKRATISRIETHAYGEEEPTTRAVIAAEVWDVHLDLEVPLRGRTVDDALSLGRDVLRLAAAASGGLSLTPESARDLLRARRADLLIGQPEGQWLECKQSPYQQDERARYELAKDVASFANGKHDGLLIVGLRTRRRGEEDVIAAVRPVPLSGIRPSSLRRILDHRIYPPLEEIEIDAVDYGGGKGLLYIVIPRQPDELRPFLVRGAFVEGELIGAHVSVVRRRTDHTVDTSISALHALLVAGRGATRADPSSREA
jgi:hypothetical protein